MAAKHDNPPKLGALVALSLLYAVASLGCAGSEESTGGEMPGAPEGAGDETEAAAVAPVDPLEVYVVNHPLEYIAGSLGGPGVDVRFPAPAEVDPAYWSPDPETVAAYQGADLVLLNGAGYARWALTASLPRARLVDTSAGYTERLIPIEEGTTHTHGPEGEHVHKGWVPTTWLDPTLAIAQAEAVGEALVAVRPDLGPAVEGNLALLVSQLEALDRRMEAVASDWADRPVLFSHPVYQYFERRYGWNGRSLHWEPDEAPTERQWRELEEILAGHPATLMIWEGEPAEATVARLEGLGIRSVVFSPMGNRPPEGDFGTAMEENVGRLEQAILGSEREAS